DRGSPARLERLRLRPGVLLPAARPHLRRALGPGKGAGESPRSGAGGCTAAAHRLGEPQGVAGLAPPSEANNKKDGGAGGRRGGGAPPSEADNTNDIVGRTTGCGAAW